MPSENLSKATKLVPTRRPAARRADRPNQIDSPHMRHIFVATCTANREPRPTSLVIIIVAVALQLIELIAQGPDTDPQHLGGLGAVAFRLAKHVHDVFVFD